VTQRYHAELELNHNGRQKFGEKAWPEIGVKAATTKFRHVQTEKVGFQFLSLGGWRWRQSTAHSSPLSKFLVTGKNTGNFSKFGIPLQFLYFISG
jgi:hypothetical protein